MLLNRLSIDFVADIAVELAYHLCVVDALFLNHKRFLGVIDVLLFIRCSCKIRLRRLIIP